MDDFMGFWGKFSSAIALFQKSNFLFGQNMFHRSFIISKRKALPSSRKAFLISTYGMKNLLSR